MTDIQIMGYNPAKFWTTIKLETDTRGAFNKSLPISNHNGCVGFGVYKDQVSKDDEDDVSEVYLVKLNSKEDGSDWESFDDNLRKICKKLGNAVCFIDSWTQQLHVYPILQIAKFTSSTVACSQWQCFYCALPDRLKQVGGLRTGQFDFRCYYFGRCIPKDSVGTWKAYSGSTKTAATYADFHLPPTVNSKCCIIVNGEIDDWEERCQKCDYYLRRYARYCHPLLLNCNGASVLPDDVEKPNMTAAFGSSKYYEPKDCIAALPFCKYAFADLAHDDAEIDAIKKAHKQRSNRAGQTRRLKKDMCGSCLLHPLHFCSSANRKITPSREFVDTCCGPVMEDDFEWFLRDKTFAAQMFLQKLSDAGIKIPSTLSWWRSIYSKNDVSHIVLGYTRHGFAVGYDATFKNSYSVSTINTALSDILKWLDLDAIPSPKELGADKLSLIQRVGLYLIEHTYAHTGTNTELLKVRANESGSITFTLLSGRCDNQCVYDVEFEPNQLADMIEWAAEIFDNPWYNLGKNGTADVPLNKDNTSRIEENKFLREMILHGQKIDIDLAHSIWVEEAQDSLPDTWDEVKKRCSERSDGFQRTKPKTKKKSKPKKDECR